MRFSAAINPQQPLQTPAVPEVHRRLAANEAQHRPPEPARADDLPADLDQRVRLIGEW